MDILVGTHQPPASPLDLSHLTLDSTLTDLPTHTFEVAVDTPGQIVADTFERYPDLPGVIIIHNAKVLGAFSRRKFLERVGRPYGVEVYLQRPIRIMLHTISTKHLQLPSSYAIHRAAQEALSRPAGAIYEPVVVTFPDNSVGLLDIYTLLLAQSQLLTLGYRLEQNRRQFAEGLQRAGRALSSTLDLHDLTGRILEELDQVVDYQRGAVMNDRGSYLEIIAQRGFPADTRLDALQIEIQAGKNDVYQRMKRTRAPILIGDVTQESSWQHQSWLPLHRSWLGVPLIAQNQVTGMISLTRVEPYAFSADDTELVLTFASQAAVALENARLYEQIIRFNDQLEQMVDQRTRELNQAYNNLEKLDQTKSNFIQIAAHELRTPLTVIRGYAQLLAASPHLNQHENLATPLSGIVSGVDRLADIINSMLDVARIASDTLDLYPKRVDLTPVIAQICAKYELDLQVRRLTLTRTGLEMLPPLHADPDLLPKVFYHLIGNAIKYTPDGGAIDITAALLDEVEPPQIEVVISDTGIGVDPQQHQIIFEKFYQTGEVMLHSSGLTKFKGGGPGLGLAIAKGIIQAHGGQIWVESPGHDEECCPGSKFFVRLPLR